MKIIAVSGQMQNGKDTVADYLQDYLIDWKRVAFAAQVKKVFCDAFDVDMEFIEKWKVIPEPPPGFNTPVRKGLQYIGDGFREIQSTIWLDYCFRKNPPPIIISDARYINELNRVCELNGCNILVWRPGKENDDPNGSEAQIRPIVEWFKNLPDKFEGDTSKLFANLTSGDLAAMPNGTNKINYFIRNEGDVQQLYDKLNSQLVPYLQSRFDEHVD